MTDNKKYELTDDSIQWSSGTLYRIRALRDFGNVKKGALGGFVQSEANLSHYGDSWVYGDAKVYERARVIENAKVMRNAKVYGKAIISKSALVSKDAQVFERAIIADFASVNGRAFVSGKAIIKDHAEISDHAWIDENAIVSRHSFVGGITYVSHNAEIAVGTPESFLETKAFIHGDALISDPNDVLVIGPIGSRNDILTVYRSKRGGIEVSLGCYHGTISEFTHYACERYRNNDLYLDQYIATISFIKQFFKINEGGKNHEK
ncbi:polymer-forming cytoskeletal protein [Gilliamella apis]|uniref:Polymer-forming cytoskeletal protein n=1 Tax=Gilliamella apis TaxID=1970738 RepID=A0A2V4DQR8_9GAMM|nr:polymer-forming cytoskeletal protein [Gilliamella apis]PXY91374.1 hypothetical protein DKK78_03315 [Gilliamella apis]WLS93640.1 hypothetical protein RAM17_10360 [Gilliamella apis]